MFKKCRIVFVSLFVVVILFACSQRSEEEKAVAQEIQAICVWDGASLRSDPSKQGKFLSALSVGEKIIFLNETAVDATDNNREYSKIRLSDGQEGWIPSALMVPDARAAAIVQKTTLYKRPDLLTGTNMEFKPMDMVAVKTEKGEWIEVVGNKKER